MNRVTKILLLAGIILFVYGYLCRMLPINFFWDSKAIGFFILLFALLSYWIALRKIRKGHGKKIVWVTIGVCILLFGLVISPVIIFKIKTSDAYTTATEYLKSDPETTRITGNIKRFGLIPMGEVQTFTNNGVESGAARFEIIVMGEKKYTDLVVDLEKSPGQQWKVTRVK